jgi:hypothetical protein
MPRVPLHTTTKDPDRPQIGVYSFGADAPKQMLAQFEFDVTTFRDPTGQKQFTTFTDGTVPAVRDWVAQDRRIPAVVEQCLMLADDMLQKKNDKEAISSWVSIAFKDHHGRWIAPAVAECVADALSDAGYRVSVVHDGLKPKVR